MRPSHRLFMSGLFITLALLCVAVSKAQGMAMDATFDHALVVAPPTDGGVQIVPYDPPEPTPEPARCPARPHDDVPNAACPDDTGTGQSCNYDSGSEGDPCPHSNYGDAVWFFRCGDGTDPDTANTVGVEFGWPETEPEAQADVTNLCAGDWYSLSVGAP